MAKLVTAGESGSLCILFNHFFNYINNRSTRFLSQLPSLSLIQDVKVFQKAN